MRITWFVSILLFGCQQNQTNEIATKEDFINSYAQEKCAKILSCFSEEESFTSIYGTQEECAEDFKEQVESSLNGQELEYNPSQGTQCVEYVQSSSCEEEVEEENDPCADVFTQPN